MSNVVDHYLRASNLKQMLLDSGVIESITLHGTFNRAVHCKYVLNMRKCHEVEWKVVEQSAKDHGVVNFSKKNDDGKYGVRRDLTKQEISELPYWPIFFNSDDELCWICKWRSNDDPAFFISKLFPNVSFEYEKFYEGDWDGGWTILNGVFETTEEWAIYAEATEREEQNAAEGVCCDKPNIPESTLLCINGSALDCESDDTLPF